MGYAQRKLIVIHGWGGTFVDAVEQFSSLISFPVEWRDGVFRVPRREGLVLRRLLQHAEPDACIEALQMFIISRFMTSCFEDNPVNDEDAATFSEARIFDDYSRFGIPFTAHARLRRATQIEVAAGEKLGPVFAIINDLRQRLMPGNGEWPSEQEAREIIRQLSPDGFSLLPLLETIRDMHETGGDLDTVGSAVMYTHWLRGRAKANDESFLYGLDYQYVFNNYHEGIVHLAKYGPSDVLLADLPIGALPDFDHDVRYLHAQGILIERFEDHHPYTREQLTMLQALVNEGLLGELHLSGPLQGDELESEDLKCGTDMVYENTIAGQPWDTEGVRQLRRAAHSEDFVTDRNELGRMLTDLIKGGVCKVQLAQVMWQSLPENDLVEQLQNAGWTELIAEWTAYYQAHEATMQQHVYLVEAARPDDSTAVVGGPALGPGSDAPAPTDGERIGASGNLKILMAMAARTEPGQPRIPVGKAVDFFARKYPEADYIFYCFGSSLMVGRRLNQADLSLNLGALMPQIGGPGDGGHAGAAVCRPEDNEHYPHAILGRVNGTTFKGFVSYLSSRLTAVGFRTGRLRDLSGNRPSPLHGSGRRILLLTVAAILVGLLLIMLNPAYRPEAILKGNENFFPHIRVETLDQAEDDAL